MTKQKTNKVSSPPKNKPISDSEAELVIPSSEETIEDILSLIDDATWKNGFYIRVRKFQMTPRGVVMSWQTERIASVELETQSTSDVLYDKFGPGNYRLNFYKADDKKMFAEKKIDIAVGDINDQRPSRMNQPGSHGDPSRRIPAIVDRVRENPDVIAKKSALEIKRLSLEDIELDEKIKRATSGDGNSSLERIVTSLGQSFKDAITQLTAVMVKPSDNGKAELERKIADMENKLSNQHNNDTTKLIMASMEGTNKMMIENMKTQTEQQRVSEQRFMDLFMKTIENDKNKPAEKPMSFTDMFQLVTKVDGYRRRNEEEYLPDITEYPEKEESIIEKVANGVVGFLNKLNQMDPNLIAKMFQGAGTVTPQPNPTTNPTPDKRYTEDELEKIADKYAREAVRQYKKDNVEPKKVIDAEKVTTTPDVVTDKKARVNEVLKKIILEIKLKPKALEWITDAYDNLPSDVIDKIAVAGSDIEIFNAISEFADAELITQLRSELLPSGLPNQINIQWIADGVKVLREMIAYGVDDNGNILYPKPEQK